MCNNPVQILKNNQSQIIPCGNWLGCRLDKTVLWSHRCNSEYVSRRSAFVTFTYDDLHLPYEENALLPTLRRKHLHNYLDNIRHKVQKLTLPYGCDNNFGYFASGEYGDSFSTSLPCFVFWIRFCRLQKVIYRHLEEWLNKVIAYFKRRY